MKNSENNNIVTSIDTSNLKASRLKIVAYETSFKQNIKNYKKSIREFQEQLINCLSVAYEEAQGNSKFDKAIALIGVELDALPSNVLKQVLGLKTVNGNMKLGDFIRKNKANTWHLERSFLNFDVAPQLENLTISLEAAVELVTPEPAKTIKTKAEQAQAKINSIIKAVDWLKKESMLDGDIVLDNNIKKAMEKIARIQRTQAMPEDSLIQVSATEKQAETKTA